MDTNKVKGGELGKKVVRFWDCLLDRGMFMRLTRAGTRPTRAGIRLTRAGTALTRAGMRPTRAGTALIRAGNGLTRAGTTLTRAARNYVHYLNSPSIFEFHRKVLILCMLA